MTKKKVDFQNPFKSLLLTFEQAIVNSVRHSEQQTEIEDQHHSVNAVYKPILSLDFGWNYYTVGRKFKGTSPTSQLIPPNNSKEYF